MLPPFVPRWNWFRIPSERCSICFLLWDGAGGSVGEALSIKFNGWVVPFARWLTEIAVLLIHDLLSVACLLLDEVRIWMELLLWKSEVLDTRNIRTVVEILWIYSDFWRIWLIFFDTIFTFLVICNSSIKNMKGNWITDKIIKQLDMEPCYTDYLIYNKYLRYSKTHSYHLHIIKQLFSKRKKSFLCWIHFFVKE